MDASKPWICLSCQGKAQLVKLADGRERPYCQKCAPVQKKAETDFQFMVTNYAVKAAGPAVVTPPKTPAVRCYTCGSCNVQPCGVTGCYQCNGCGQHFSPPSPAIQAMSQPLPSGQPQAAISPLTITMQRWVWENFGKHLPRMPKLKNWEDMV